MSKRGRMKYVPRVIIDEMEDIKLEKGLRADCDAMREMANYSQVGREAERLMGLNFRHKPKERRGWLL